MTVKRIIAFLVSVLLLSLCACGEKADKDNPMGGWDTLTENALLLENLSSKKESTEISDGFCDALRKSSFDYFGASIEDGKDDENILVSPLSIYTALAMTACGAEDNTLYEMQKILGDVPIEEVARSLYGLCEALTKNEAIKLGLANSVWVRDNKGMIEVNENFTDVVKDYFSADTFLEKFDSETVEKINLWIEDKTDGMIRDMLSSIPEEAVMYLINALVFEAEWQEKYDSIDLRNHEFAQYSGEKIDTELMFGTEDYYLCDDDAVGFIKPYADSRYAFVALLPNSDVDVYEYAKGLSGKDFAKMLEEKERAVVETAIPQFSYEYEDSFVNELKALGMKDAFNSSAANFAGLGRSSLGNIYISNILHKTFIEVSPAGTKAGAATAVELECESAEMIVDAKIYEVFLDRPFVYAITDMENGLPIFLGVLGNIEE